MIWTQHEQAFIETIAQDGGEFDPWVPCPPPDHPNHNHYKHLRRLVNEGNALASRRKSWWLRWCYFLDSYRDYIAPT